MNTKRRFESKRIDHLGIVAGICHEIGLIRAIDEAVGSTGRKVSCGAAVQAMVLNALGFSSRALYLMPQYLNNKPVDLLIAPGLTAEDFNDDTLGRSLDQLFETGVTEVFARVAQQALNVYGIETRFYHLDSTTFHVHGQYKQREENSQEKSNAEESSNAEENSKEATTAQPALIEITYGYSKDHRPDLKQVVVNLITAHRSQLPVWMEALSGNQSDRASFPKTIQAFRKQVEEGEEPFFVVDSALYSADNLKTLEEIRWLTRVPATIAEAKRLMEETDLQTMTALENGYAYREVSSNYGGVAQRWLVVHSTQAAQREEKTLQRRVAKEKAEVQRAWRKLQSQVFHCQEDSEMALKALQKKWKYHQVAGKVVPVTRYPSRGRPAGGATPQIVGFRLAGEVRTSEHLLEQARRGQGRFVLATNECQRERLPAEAMLSQYKSQSFSVERGFRFLKDPLFFADSLFLKNPGRIMALTMIMTLALLVYALAERKLRTQLQETGQSIPNQTGKATQTPTMRWVFQIFEGVDVLLIWEDERLVQRQVLNLTPLHLDILHLLGPPVENCYLLRF